MTNWFSQTTTTTNIIFILPPTLTLTVDSTNPNSSSSGSSSLNIINNVSSPTNQTTMGASDYMVEFTVQNVLLAFFLISLGLSTILGNTFVLLAIFVDFHLRSPTHYLMGSLALADLLLGTLVLPFSSTQLYFESWPFGERFCEIWLTTDVLCCTASIYLVLVISIDRYIGITRPLRYSTIMTKRRIYLIILFVWTLSLVVSLAPQIGWKSPQNSSKICEVNEDLAYALFSASLSFYIPLAIILIVYYRIFKEARAQSRFLKTGIKTSKASDGLSEVTLRVHIGPTTNQNQPSRSSGHHTGSHNRHQQHHHLHSSSHSTAAGGGAAASNARYSHSSMCICRTGSNSSMGGGYRASGGGGRRSGVSMVGMNARRCGYPMSLSRREMSEMSSKNFESYIDDDIIQKELPSSPVTVVAPAVGSSQHHSNGGPKSGIFSAKSSVKSVNIANTVGKSGSGGSGTGPKTGSNRNSNTNSAELCKYCSTSVNNLSGSTGVLANKFAKFKSEQKAAKTLAIVVGCFTLCWLPFFLILPIESLKLLPIPKIVFRVFFWLGYCNSAMNPLIYALSSREFRRAYKGILKCNLKYRSKKENKKYINYKFKTNFM